MAWIAAYHGLARAAFALKRVLGRRPPTDATARAQYAELAAHTAGVAVDDAFVDEVAKPPGGRLQPVLLTRVARAFAADPQRVATTLFPTRRPSPYSLEP